MLIQNYTSKDFIRNSGLEFDPTLRVLNAGSSTTRYGDNCTNVDIQAKPGVDLVCDVHKLPGELSGQFDIVVCTAVLQYCADARRVAWQLYRVLKPGGLAYIEAPWIQGYCRDTPDRYRYSLEELRTIFGAFDIVESGPAITSGSALAYLAYQMAEDATDNRYFNFALRNFVKLVFWPMRHVRTKAEDKLAGSFYLVGRK